jgi:hypothetical protein
MSAVQWERQLVQLEVQLQGNAVIPHSQSPKTHGLINFIDTKAKCRHLNLKN